MKRFVKNLRQNQTEAERKLWQNLRGRRCAGFKFRRQHVFDPYVVDFVCLGQKLVIEVDGGQHMQRVGYDSRRTACLASLGFRVVRFWSNDVLLNTRGVLEAIRKELAGSPHPDPLPTGERGGAGRLQPFPSPRLRGEGRVRGPQR